jgi:hypothetical protein
MFRHSLSRWIALALLAALPFAAACTTASAGAEEVEEKPPPSIVGETTRAAVEAAEPDWVAAEVDASPDADAVAALADVPPGARVVVLFGTWCSDSRRELARLWRGFDDAGIFDASELPFEIEYVAVDRAKVEPAERTEGMDLRFVPTFVVYRDGSEVGRMVEVSPNGIEHDLLALLTGEARGVVSARDDLGTTSGDGDGR